MSGVLRDWFLDEGGKTSRDDLEFHESHLNFLEFRQTPHREGQR